MNEEIKVMQPVEKEQRPHSISDSSGFAAYHAEKHNGVEEGSATEDALRIVQQVFVLQANEPPRVVVFAGVDHGNGCSRIAAAVAEALAKNSRKPICLVEANFRSPGLSSMFKANNQQGLTDALRGGGPVRSFAKAVSPANLWLLPSGPLAADSPNLLTSEIFQYRLDELRGEFETIIIDAPPLNEYTDAVLLGQRADGLVLVLEAEATRKEAASAIVANLRSANVRILAAVLNKRSFPIPKGIYSRL